MRIAINAHAITVLALFATLGGAATLAQAQQRPEPVSPATPTPVAPQPSMAPAPLADDNDPWRNVVPERGVVVAADGTPYAPLQAAPPVVYAPPVYVQPAYAWPQAYVYPPVGISLNLGYSRGWHGGGHGGWHHHRGWR